MLKAHRVYVSIARKHGAEIVSVTIGRKHAKLRLRAGPREQWFSLSCSPGDERTYDNFSANVRRWLRGLPPTQRDEDRARRRPT